MTYQDLVNFARTMRYATVQMRIEFAGPCTTVIYRLAAKGVVGDAGTPEGAFAAWKSMQPRNIERHEISLEEVRT